MSFEDRKDFTKFNNKNINLAFIKDTFESVKPSDSIVLFNRESTKNGSPINKTFTLGYSKIRQAVLKVSLLSDQGKILGFIPNEFVLRQFTINGKIFNPSDPRNSVNILQRSSDQILNEVLIPNGENTISIDFNAPIGAGLVSPDAEISAFLIINGNKDPFSINRVLPNTTQLKKDIGKFIKENTVSFFLILILVAVILLAIAKILSDSRNITKPLGTVKGALD